MIKAQEKVAKLLRILTKSRKKGVAWLVDPEKLTSSCFDFSDFGWVSESSLDLILVGGSSLQTDNFDEAVSNLKKLAGKIPVVLFPGSQLQISTHADAILFLSLLSGRNPEFLIGQQVKGAPKVQRSGLEVLPTAYLLVNEGELKSVHQTSQTLPIPNSEINEAVATALAGSYMGMKFCFLDAGSGAEKTVSSKVIQAIRSAISSPLIVGGGIDNLQKLNEVFESGADLIVVGNQIEKDPGFLSEVLKYKDWYNLSLHVD
ncbi:geranylgeranylglyceryl/heptaprenylglyceryl phosphate synthase [Algoriphagus sp. CAU 1675]|uniref:geranylgeranylglyceryl/heptaprenylglyceryl phosphate synthase n=1 Tax=Algoriphagus sp. CAU 1675 TaxID=3032597 RepID=UPI0023DB6466|nr:geranylgeranylglyceryl/heptaprenylglyceryl phosphate synthase [Algoriphagus sp. CAU 1675]MDF2156636.1 geranylgeranylglyceryl/heptaprenylglyceryl phosphate synthase [Algoriphagus sp. CAU 1675]